LHHLEVVHVLPKSWAQLVTCSSPFERGWILLRSVSNCYNKIWLTLNDPPNLVDLPPHNSLRIVGWPSSPSRFVHRFEDGKKCSFWALTPCASIRLAKTWSWTLGLDPRLCPLGGHDAWTCAWRTTYMFPRSWHYPWWEWNVPLC
jgi:hypothetical protein